MYSMLIAPILGSLLWTLPTPPPRVVSEDPGRKSISEEDGVQEARRASSGFGDNLEILAEDLVRGQANVTIIGDSVNTFGNTNSMFKGYLLAWQPNRWRELFGRGRGQSLGIKHGTGRAFG